MSESIVYEVCLVCGNKRCPKSADIGMMCSMSNAVGQVGVVVDALEVVHKSGKRGSRCGVRSQSGMLVNWDYRRVTCLYCLRAIHKSDIENLFSKKEKGQLW